jgi:hypothetical protein
LKGELLNKMIDETKFNDCSNDEDRLTSNQTDVSDPTAVSCGMNVF